MEHSAAKEAQACSMAMDHSAESLCKALKFHFGHEQFRPFQLEAVQATLAGRDSLLILPTGGGKSMTFQLPALAKGDCFTVVVGPLMALAKDQVDSCLDLGIDARVWNSDTSDEARRGIQSDLISDAPDMRLLYTTPESLRNPTLRGYLKEAYEAGTLLSFAIDEAHCVSEWGHDFRPAYLELATLKADFPNVPIAAMTASCTPTVETGIVKVLKLQNPLLIKGGFNRPSIEYKVLYKELIGEGKEDAVVEHLVDFIKAREGQCGIIYARLRATCDWLGSALGSCDLDVGVYHAGKDAARRRKVQQDWCEGGLDIVVATVAFGMGIDRADVRWVVHWDVPSSLEGYYQESGRAGRDGQPSEAVMYVSADDIDTITKLEKGIRAGAAASVAAFSCQGGCKRKKVLDYFGQRRGPCNSSQGELLCDFCSQPAATRSLLQQWEQQLHRKAVAHTLREQRLAAGAADEDESPDGVSQQAGSRDPETAIDASESTAGHCGWQTGGKQHCSSTSNSSRLHPPGRPRAGAWVPARAHDQTTVAAPAAGASTAAATKASQLTGGVGTSSRYGGHFEQENAPAMVEPPCTSESATAGVLGATSSMAHSAATPAAAVPQLRKRQLSRGPSHVVGAFKAPRRQPSSSRSKRDEQHQEQQEEQPDLSADAAAGCASSCLDAATLTDTTNTQGLQPKAAKAATRAEAPAAKAAAPVSCATGIQCSRPISSLGLKGGRLNSSRHSFVPPFKRSG